MVRAIHAECKDLKIDAEIYDTHIILDKSMDFTSVTLIRVLESISDRFTNSLFSALICNIVKSVVKSKTMFFNWPLVWYFVLPFKNDNQSPVYHVINHTMKLRSVVKGGQKGLKPPFKY